MRSRYLFRNAYFYSDDLLDLKDALIRGSNEMNPTPPKRSFPAALNVLRETQSDEAGLKLFYDYALQASNDLLFTGSNPLRVMKICAALLPRLPRRTNGTSNRFYASAINHLTHSLAGCMAAGDPQALSAIRELQTLQTALDTQSLSHIFSRKPILTSPLLQDVQKVAQTSGFSDRERSHIQSALAELLWETTKPTPTTPLKPISLS